MTDDDLDRVVELEHEIFPEPWSRSFFRADLRRLRCLNVVAELDGDVVGYAVAWPEEELHVANIAVAPAARRRGIGRMLMDAVDEFARAVLARSLYLEVRRSNEIALLFYRRLGFVQTYVRRGYYTNGEDAVIMEKDVVPEEGVGVPRNG